MKTNLSFLDIGVIVIGLLVMVVIGFFGKSRSEEEDFYLASRSSNIFYATMSFIATEISAMTIVGVPSVSFSDNWSYLQFFGGSAISRLLIAYLFIPVFYKYNCLTIYDFAGRRFSNSVRLTLSVFFFITRLFASGIRLYAATMTISIMMGISIEFVIVAFVIFSLFFVSWGGMKSVMKNGTYQACMFYVAAGLIIMWASKMSGDGLPSVFSILYSEGKLKVINFSGVKFDTFILAFLNGVFGSFASFGTDYEMMQKLLTVGTRSKSQRTILWTIIAAFLLVVLYLSVGSSIYYFVKKTGVDYHLKSDEVVGWFASNYMPSGLKGVVLLVIFLATVDLPLLSLSTSFVNDIYAPYVKIKNNDNIKIARISMVAFAFILSLIAYECRNVSEILWFGFEVHGITAGSMLGVFLLGMLSKKKFSSFSIILSMILSSLVCLSFMLLNRKGITSIPWSSFVIIGTMLAFTLPWIFEGIFKKLPSGE